MLFLNILYLRIEYFVMEEDKNLLYFVIEMKILIVKKKILFKLKLMNIF